ncbi:MAG TPA: hypothetical protein VGW77_30160 [Candidatus Binatia bacterium]|jgi:hypothetical protein|nr:hypothetical protein [Candidatus Binatia bacterium]
MFGPRLSPYGCYLNISLCLPGKGDRPVAPTFHYAKAQGLPRKISPGVYPELAEEFEMTPLQAAQKDLRGEARDKSAS